MFYRERFGGQIARANDNSAGAAAVEYQVEEDPVGHWCLSVLVSSRTPPADNNRALHRRRTKRAHDILVDEHYGCRGS